MSIQSRLFLGFGLATRRFRQTPTLETLAERRAGFESVGKWTRPEEGTRITKLLLGGVAVDSIINCEAPEHTIAYLHGGGFVYKGNQAHLQMLSELSRLANATVLAIDYPVAPEHPFPEALNDIQNVLNSLNVPYTLAGDSAGGNLVLSTAVTRRDSGLSMPEKIVLISPSLDATFSGDSIGYNKMRDPSISKEKLDFFLTTYANGHDKLDPMLSPLYADLSGLPPVLFHVAKNELLYSDSLNAHHKILRSGGNSTLYDPDNLWHVWHVMSRFIPESRDAMQQISRFITK